MKTLSYDRDTVALFKFLKGNTPDRIYIDGCYAVNFDYEDFYITAVPEDSIAATQNRSGEAIFAKFERIESAFEPHKMDKLTFQGKAIDRLWILQTMLYFTDSIVFRSEAKALGDFEDKTETDEIIANLMKTSRSRYEEVVCHPDSEEAKSVNREFANLVDTGIMLEIDSQLLMCFSCNNSFSILGNTISNDEIKEKITPFYKLVEI